MGRLMVITALCALLVAPLAQAKKRYYEVVVTDPYIELHTGPGRGYPIFHVIDRGEQIEVIKRRTDWFKVRNDRGVTGWASAQQMARTMEPTGRPAKIENPDRDDYTSRQREAGIMLGDFEGANVISAYGSWLFTPNLGAEIWGSLLTGDFSNGWMVNANIVHTPFPEWWISPFLTLGTGVLHVDPKSSLVSAEDRTDQTAHAGIGLRAHLTRRFLLRAEYKTYKVFTSRDDNEEVAEWKAGFSFFF
ncbi:MAG: SH3 domain-containing protein [Gammaproteobacteria bacterium]|nr:SH3 domain-containing protein [Gammaproteobacteria bacterium]